MALIKWGSLVVDGRGKLGGQVLSKNRTGNYIRNKVTPVNPRTSFQQTARQELGALSSQWKNLTESQRDAWRGAVAQYMKTNVFGDSVEPTGKNLFVGLNRNLVNVRETPINLPAAPQELPVLELNSVTTPDGALTVSTNDLSTYTDVAVLLFATPSLSPGVNFVESEFRMIGVFDASDTATPLDASTFYADRFGGMVDGQKLFVRLVLVSTISGQKGVPVKGSTIVEL